MGEDEGQAPSFGSSEEGTGASEDGKGVGGYAGFDACGPQEGAEAGGLELSEQPSVEVSTVKPK